MCHHNFKYRFEGLIANRQFPISLLSRTEEGLVISSLWVCVLCVPSDRAGLASRTFLTLAFNFEATLQNNWNSYCYLRLVCPSSWTSATTMGHTFVAHHVWES